MSLNNAYVTHDKIVTHALSVHLDNVIPDFNPGDQVTLHIVTPSGRIQTLKLNANNFVQSHDPFLAKYSSKADYLD